ncbi:putative phage replication protein [Escherichia coli 88.0221]|uniref:hypothetical protein n=1 Tax=Escherichia coli TaxID=562 RepID=UPI00028E95DE|nr:hypothetical protein [Escherichia coli]EKK85842.1 putative phage replication protein [Escherichia coli 88.0221]
MIWQPEFTDKTLSRKTGAVHTDISDVSRELIAAIKQGYLTVKAAGVWAGGIETPSVETPSEGSKFFGFDMDNEFISGFDVGAWGVLL